MPASFAFVRSSVRAIVLTVLAGCPSWAGQDAAPDAPALSTLKALLGKKLDSKEMMEFRKKFKEPQKVSKYDDALYHSWTDHGVSFLFKEDVLDAFFLYAEGADKFKQYRGELPEGLRILETRREVEQKLGEPKISGGEEVIPFWAAYPSKGVSITYVSKDTKDLGNRIHHLTVYAARDK